MFGLRHFPYRFIALTLELYGTSRRVAFGRSVSRQVYSFVGIVAGCPVGTYILRMILQTVIDVVALDSSWQYEGSFLGIYVHDLAVQVIGAAARALDVFRRAIILLLTWRRNRQGQISHFSVHHQLTQQNGRPANRPRLQTRSDFQSPRV